MFCLILSDSGSVSEESNILDFPAVLIRTSSERQEAELQNSISRSGYDVVRILQEINNSRNIHPGKPILADYFDYDFSLKILDILIIRIKYVNSCVWHKI